MAEHAHGPFDDEESLPGVPRRGDVVGGKYVVGEIIALGGMGTIVEAEHVELRQRVAIKLMPRRAAKVDAAVRRFLREARAAASIQNDHVVRVFDVGRLDTGIPYLVMEHLDGKTLAELVLTKNPMPIEEALDYVLQASVAIAECHAKGIVHRDLKPENMMVLERPGQRGFVKVLDFGISKMDWVDPGTDKRSSLTTTLDVFGTPTHMSPEQVRSAKSVDARTDIWALGVVLYEVLTGLPPFMADTLTALSAMIVSDAPRRPIERRPDIPVGLDQAVMRCLEKRAEARPQSVAELAELLVPFLAPPTLSSIERIRSIARGAEPSAAQATPALPASAAQLSAPRETVSAWGTTGMRRERRRSVVLGVSLGALVFAIGLFGFAVWHAIERLRAHSPAPHPSQVAPSAPAPVPQPPVTARVLAPERSSPGAAPSATATPPMRLQPVPRSRQGPLDDRF